MLDFKESKVELQKPENINIKNLTQKNLSKLEDKAQDCNAYLRIKHFLAKQVIELESKIDERDSFILAAAIKINTYTKLIENAKKKFNKIRNKYKFVKTKYKKCKNYIKNHNEERKINKEILTYSNSDESPKNNDKKTVSDQGKLDNNLNLSNETDSCYSLEKIEIEKCKDSPCIKKDLNENLNNIINDLKIKNDYYLSELEKSKKSFDIYKKEFDKKNNIINDELSEYKRRNLLLNSQIKIKDSKISKLESQNILLLNELIEIIQTIRTIDVKVLNKIFLENLTNKTQEDLETIKLTSTLGLKYNILSAESFLTYLLNSNNNKEKDDKIFHTTKKNLNSNNNIDHKDFKENKNKEKNKNSCNKGKNNSKDFDFYKTFDNFEFIEKKDIEESPNAAKIKQHNEEENNKEKSNNNSSSSRSSLTNEDDSNLSSNSSSLDEFFNINYGNDQSPLYILKKSDLNSNKNNVNLNDNQNDNKFFDFCNYEKKLNNLLENNLVKNKLLNLSDTD